MGLESIVDVLLPRVIGHNAVIGCGIVLCSNRGVPKLKGGGFLSFHTGFGSWPDAIGRQDFPWDGSIVPPDGFVRFESCERIGFASFSCDI